MKKLFFTLLGLVIFLSSSIVYAQEGTGISTTTIPTIAKENEFLVPGSIEKSHMKDVLESIKNQDEILIKFKGTVDIKGTNQMGITSIDNLNKKHGVLSVEKIFKGKQKLPAGKFVRSDKKEIEVPDLTKWYKIKLPKSKDLISIINEYSKNPNVEYVGPNMKATLFSSPNDPLFQYQWDLNNSGQGYFSVIKNASGNRVQVTKYGTPDADIDLPEALNLLTGSEQETIVAVIDTGLDYNHEDIVGRVWTNLGEIPNNGIDDDGNGYIDDVHGWDFSDNDNDPMDCHGHGTHCSGTIAATIDNSIGIAGINPKATIMPIKIFNSATEDSIAEAIRYAADNEARVMSNSWGFSYGYNPIPVQDAINYAYAKGAVIVFAAGNDGCECISYPAAGENTIAVSATNSTDQHASFTTYGPWIDVAAPGVDILSLRYGDMYGDGVHNVTDKYYIASGTSMAAPHVAGLASLILSKHPEFTNDEVLQVIRQSADDIESPGWDLYSGYGRINVEKALKIDSVCIAKITEPHMNDAISRITSLNVKISAFGTNFNNYILEYGKGKTPSSWTTIKSSSSPIIDGYAASLNLNNLDFGSWTIRLKVNDNLGKTFEDRVVFTVSPSQLSGWPILAATDLHQSPTIADINNDGYKEIIVGETSQSISVYDYHGNKLLNVPAGINGADNNMPAVADLYPELPGKEIVGMQVNYTGQFPNFYFTNYLNLIDKNGNTVYNWPKILSQYYYSYGIPQSDLYIPTRPIRPTIIADMNNDSYLEIIQPLALNQNKIYVFDRTGNQIQGWPFSVGYSKMAVGKIDNDSELEIAVVTSNQLFVLKANGTYSSEWPIKTFNINYLYDQQPVLADMDKDGLDEIIIRIPDEGVYIFNGDGTVAEGSWPVLFEGSDYTYPVVADINNDGYLEIVIIGGNYGDLIYVINHDGTIANGWPKQIPSTITSPVIGDIDGDGYKEIVAVSSADPTVKIFKYDGSILAEWSLGCFISPTSPALGDLDNDGGLELIATTFDVGIPSKIVAYDFGMSSGVVSWPMLGNDEKHQSRYALICNSNGIASDGLCHVECKASGNCTGAEPGEANTCCYGCYYVDVNGDGKIRIDDILLVAQAFGKNEGDPGWNLSADINKDSKIRIDDVLYVAQNFGKDCQ
jgi:subtilisin family serine protease